MPMRAIKNSLAGRLVLYILLFSSVVTLLSTAIQLFFEYTRDLETISRTVNQVEQTHLSTIISSMWVYDLVLLETELQGIKELPDVEHVSIVKDGSPVLAVGSPPEDQYQNHLQHYQYPLWYTHRGEKILLGTLNIDITLTGVYQRLRDRVVVILITQSVKTFLVSLFIFLLFYFLVGRHLVTMASFATSFSLDRLTEPLVLNRPQVDESTKDELGLVESAINTMRTNLMHEMDRVRVSREALMRNEEQFRSLVNNIPGMVYRRESEYPWQINYISPSVSELCGHPVDDFAMGTMPFATLVDPDDLDKVKKDFGQNQGAGAYYESEYRLRHRDGSNRWVIDRGQMIYDSDSKEWWQDGVILDISARKRVEKQRDEKELLLRSIIENTSDAIFFKDLNGRYVLANTATLQAIGKPANEVIGKRDGDVFPKDSASTIEAIDSTVLQERKSVLDEEHLQTSYGDTVWQTNKSPLFDDQGNLLGMVGISRNITEIKNSQREREELERRLAQAQKMEAVGTLAGGIAHDFNNILGVIIGYAELAKDDAPADSRLVHDIDHILAASTRAKELVAHILAFSRQSNVAPISLELQSLVKETLKMLRASIPSTIQIETHIDAGCPSVLADPTQLNQIIMNLCTNAFHAMEREGGTLRVAVTNAPEGSDGIRLPTDLQPGSYVILEVADTGTGIDAEILDKIYEPFFTTKEVGKGTGMGLAIIHGIMKKCGGTIDVTSEPGKGSIFRVYFPACQQPPENEEEFEKPITQGNEHVLLIDDEPLLVTMGQAMLQRLGYSVTVRTNSLDALTTFQNDPTSFDIVITDQTMPGITGLDLSRKMLQIRPDIPIVLCTGYSSLVDEAQAKALGIREFLNKPLQKSILATVIRAILDDL